MRLKYFFPAVKKPLFIFITALLYLPSWLYAENNKAILIGISQYADPDFNDLAYADEDVKTFDVVLKNFSEDKNFNITLLLNDRAKKADILKVIMDAVKESQKKQLDNFLLVYAGHGIPGNIQSNKTNSFLAPHDSVLNEFFSEGSNGMINNETFINKAWLVKQLSSINAKSVIMILDSCYSGTKDFGALYAENYGFKLAFTDNQGNKRGVTIVQKGSGMDFGDKKIAFIASSKEGQQSAEYKDLKHGALSYAIFEYLNIIRKETEANEVKDITIDGIFTNVNKLFETIQVGGISLAAVHQPVLFTIPEDPSVKNMKFMSVRGIKKPQVKTGIVEIITDPDAAEIYVDGVKAEKLSNTSLELVEGKHLIALYLQKTSYNHSFVVDVKDGQQETIKITLRGNLEVETYAQKPSQKPATLDVYIDTEHVGKSPLSLTNLVAGTHNLKVITEGVAKERQIEIRPASPLLVRYKIIREPAPVKKKDEKGVDDVTF